MKFFYDLKIAHKLLIGFASLLLITLFIGGFAILQLATVNQNTYELGTNWMPSVNAAMGIKERVSRIRSQEAQLVSAENEHEVEKYYDRVKEAVDGLRVEEDIYSKLLSSENEKKLYADYQRLMADYLKISAQILDAKRHSNSDEASKLMRTVSSKTNTELRNIVDKLVDINVNGGKEAYQQGQVIYNNARFWIITLIIVCLVLGTVMAISIARIVANPLQEAVKLAQTVAAGDLSSTISVNSKDETGLLLSALKEMNANLLKVVSEVKNSAEEINVASGQIAQGNMELSSRTENQAASLEETASSMEEITSTMKHNSDNARQANQLSFSASEVAQKGGAVVNEVVQTMGSINESSKKIVDIISVIDGIAFQTNILALNAAVEAARAGEQGRGFAVVASEVRNLAQRSASAAKEIKSLINDSVEKVELGSRLVDQAGLTMQEVVDSVKRVSDIISEITAASTEQSSGIDQVNTSVMQIDQITQQNAALVEEAAAAASSLQNQTQKLSDLVSVFKLSEQNFIASSPVSQPKVNKPSIATKAKPAISQVKRVSSSSKPVAAPMSKPVTKKMATTSNDDWEEF